jgi:hypothetical protein
MYIRIEPVKTGDSVDHFRLSAASRARSLFMIAFLGLAPQALRLRPLSRAKNVEHVAFAATRVKQFERVFSVDLFAQAIHIDLDRI